MTFNDPHYIIATDNDGDTIKVMSRFDGTYTIETVERGIVSAVILTKAQLEQLIIQMHNLLSTAQ